MMLGDLEGDGSEKDMEKLKKGTWKLYTTGCSAPKVSVRLTQSHETRLFEFDAILENSGGFFKFLTPQAQEWDGARKRYK
jgi:hypothetical protein